MNAKAEEGVFIDCLDDAIFEFIQFVNRNGSEQDQFIKSIIPPRSLFVKTGSEEFIRKKINEMVTKNTFSEEYRKK